MTSHERILALLDDFVDGHLEPPEQEEVAAHLESCPSCARELKSLRLLLKEAGELPEGLEPPRDLWPELALRLKEAPAREPAEVISLDGL